MAEEKPKKNKWREQYDDSKKNLKKLNIDLKKLYGIKDLENRAYQFKVLKEQYGMDLGAYHQLQVDKLEESKKILTSRYVIESPNPGMKPEYTSDASATKNQYVMGANVNVEYGTTLNPHYDKKLDLKSEWHVQKRKEDGGTYEADFETQKQQEYTEAFNYGTAGNTDAWGRDYDHKDYGIDPANINRVTTPTTTTSDNNNNKTVKVTDGKDKKKVINNGGAGSAAFGGETTSGGLGAEDGDLIAKNPGEPPKNRLELMTKEIAENPSRIQEGLIESGFTAERLAQLKIKHQDWKKERKNRNSIKVEATAT